MNPVERIVLTIGIIALFPFGVFGFWAAMIALDWDPKERRGPTSHPMVRFGVVLLVITLVAFAVGAGIDFWENHP